MDELKQCPFCGYMPTMILGHYHCKTPNCPGNARPVLLEIWQDRPLEDVLEAENAVLRDRLNAIHATAEVINSTAWLTEANQYRLDYVLEQSDLTVHPPFGGKLSPEAQTFIAGVEAKNGNP